MKLFIAHSIIWTLFVSIIGGFIYGEWFAHDDLCRAVLIPLLGIAILIYIVGAIIAWAAATIDSHSCKSYPKKRKTKK